MATVAAVALTMNLSFSAQVPVPVLTLDKFESTDIRVVQPAETNPEARYLWNQFSGDPSEGPDPGLATISPLSVSREGSRSLKVSVTTGNLYLQFYPWDGVNWRNMRTYVDGTWTNDTYNRMRLWIRVPAQVTANREVCDGVTIECGQSNMYIGTYVRRQTELHDVEAGGGHFYHAYDLGHAGGNWEQLILDPHPDTTRGDPGSLEQGVKLYPTGEPGYNYFDGMTRFYLDFVRKLQNPPADFYVDGVELYRETRDENLEQVYGVHGVYIPQTNTLRVGWKRHKDENVLNHEVRYAFTDIFDSGWSAATVPPGGGVVAPLGFQGYNGMAWSTNAIDVTGRSAIYIGIKPQNSDRFRQIVIPIPPVAPTNVTILRKPS